MFMYMLMHKCKCIWICIWIYTWRILIVLLIMKKGKGNSHLSLKNAVCWPDDKLPHLNFANQGKWSYHVDQMLLYSSKCWQEYTNSNKLYRKTLKIQVFYNHSQTIKLKEFYKLFALFVRLVWNLKYIYSGWLI